MTLVKLDSGDYINTAMICRMYLWQGKQWEAEFTVDGESQEITEADRDRIVEAMRDKFLASTKTMVNGIRLDGDKL